MDLISTFMPFVCLNLLVCFFLHMLHKVGKPRSATSLVYLWLNTRVNSVARAFFLVTKFYWFIDHFTIFQTFSKDMQLYICNFHLFLVIFIFMIQGQFSNGNVLKILSHNRNANSNRIKVCFCVYHLFYQTNCLFHYFFWKKVHLPKTNVTTSTTTTTTSTTTTPPTTTTTLVSSFTCTLESVGSLLM